MVIKWTCSKISVNSPDRGSFLTIAASQIKPAADRVIPRRDRAHPICIVGRKVPIFDFASPLIDSGLEQLGDCTPLQGMLECSGSHPLPASSFLQFFSHFAGTRAQSQVEQFRQGSNSANCRAKRENQVESRTRDGRVPPAWDPNFSKRTRLSLQCANRHPPRFR